MSRSFHEKSYYRNYSAKAVKFVVRNDNRQRKENNKRISERRHAEALAEKA